jgi:hypothetical protein
VDSFWCMCTVMHVSRLVRWMRVKSVRSVIMTISLRITQHRQPKLWYAASQKLQCRS